MAKVGKDTIVAVQATVAWGTSGTVGAGDGVLATSIDQGSLQGNVVFDDTIGMPQLRYADIMMHEANPTIVIPLRWDGALWTFPAYWFGDDTKTGADPYVHTMNYSETISMDVGGDGNQDCITMAVEINNADIIEWPSVLPQQISLEPDGEGFWQMTVNCIGNTILYDSDATNDGTAFNAVTYRTSINRVRYRALSLKIAAQGANPNGETAKNVTDVALTLTRPLEIPDTIQAVSTGAERRPAVPIQNGHPEMIFSFSEPEYAAIADLDDLQDQTQKTMDFEMSETISAKSYSMLWEFGMCNPIPAAMAVELGARIPLTKNYRLIKPQAAATGQATANPIHFVLTNQDNITYESGS